MSPTFDEQRNEMVQRQLKQRGIRAPAVLEAFSKVPRHRFISEELSPQAYQDHPLPISNKQTISQPYIVAYMLEYGELTPESLVLDIGTGSGYSAALAAEIAKKVVTIERIPQLYESAKKLLQELDYTNIDFLLGDGTLGVPEQAPFDAIFVAATAPYCPDNLKKQLTHNGSLIIPIQEKSGQTLFKIKRIDQNKWETTSLLGVRFVPLIGEEGF